MRQHLPTEILNYNEQTLFENGALAIIKYWQRSRHQFVYRLDLYFHDDDFWVTVASGSTLAECQQNAERNERCSFSEIFQQAWDC